MISKLEFYEWKQHKITKKLLEIIEAGRFAAVEELVRNRKSVGDFQRGAVEAYNDITQEVLKGENLVEVDIE